MKIELIVQVLLCIVGIQAVLFIIVGIREYRRRKSIYGVLRNEKPLQLPPDKPQYELTQKEGQQGIKCLTCRFTSYNYNDIKYLYCGQCHKFHNTI